MTQVLLYHACFLSPSALHFLLRPFLSALKVSLSQPSRYRQILIFFSLISVTYFYIFLQQDSAVELPCLLICSIVSSSIYLCGLQSMSTPPLSLPHSASRFIPSHLSPSLPLQLWQRMISPPILCPGCPGQELQCGGSRGGGWGLGGDLREMDLI